ncbi:MAG: hypothetical protein GEU88_19990 [Solirubrobacterales bacterium]|nr:hypothetical protein [Solirubrobacterales bacterium]
MTLAGFPAAELKDAHQPLACLIGVDVADGQHLSIYTTDIPEDGTQDEICEAAAEFSAALLEELRDRRAR